jgi:hypothetical protein
MEKRIIIERTYACHHHPRLVSQCAEEKTAFDAWFEKIST